MCGRYTLVVGFLSEKMAALIEMCNSEADPDERVLLRENGEIFPSDNAPVLLVERGGVRPASMRWGFAKKGGGLMINARSEDARARATFKRLVDDGRCVMPAYGYFEWRDSDHMRYLIRSEDAFYLAGLYRMEDDGRRHFVVLTRDSVDAHARIHSRMPLTIASREDARRWLSGAMTLEELRSRPPSELQIEPASPEQLSIDFSAQLFEE